MLVAIVPLPTIEIAEAAAQTLLEQVDLIFYHNMVNSIDYFIE